MRSEIIFLSPDTNTDKRLDEAFMQDLRRLVNLPDEIRKDIERIFIIPHFPHIPDFPDLPIPR